MKTKMIIMLMPLLLCQCHKSQSLMTNAQNEKVKTEDFTERLAMMDKEVEQKANAQGEYNYHKMINTKIETWKSILSEVEKEYGSMSDQLAMTYTHVGDSLADPAASLSARNQFAIECFHKALPINKKVHGENSYHVGMNYAKLGWAEGDEASLETALSILKPVCGEQSYEVAQVYEMLGNIYRVRTNSAVRAGVDQMVSTHQDYYSAYDYECIIKELELALHYYQKAYAIHSYLGDEYWAETLKEDIKHIEAFLAECKDGLAHVKKK